jgi:ABC-type lipoprotein export system ATPase subunit/ABC-type antimicrobial peptide transport system permease subunit
MLLIKNLSKTYKTDDAEVKALDGVDIAFPDKGTVFVLGKSGSGKSTLLNLIAGFDVPCDGEILVDGRRLTSASDYDDYRNNTIGFIFQEFNLNKSLNAEQNILLSERLKRGGVDSKKAAEALSAVGLSDKAKKKVNKLSGGERQRVAIARALIKKPKLILADEPTGKLDETNGKIVFDILKSLSEKILVVVVSHDRESAEKYADRIIELSDGRVVSDKLKNPRYIAETTTDGDGVYLLRGKRLNQNDLDILNENADKPVILSRETKFAAFDAKKSGSIPSVADGNCAEKRDSAHIIADGKNKAAKKKKNRGLRGKDIFFLAYKNLTSRMIKTLSSIVICVVLFATLGLSTVIVSYDEYQAAAHTFIKNGESDVIITKRDGGQMSGDVIAELKTDYPDGYLELYPLFGFEFPDYLTQSDADGLTGVTGVFEMEGSELAKLGYTLMNFSDVPNIFAYAEQNPSQIDVSLLPDGFPESVLDSPADILAFYTFAGFLSENQDIVEYINANPGLLDDLQNNPDFLEELQNDPDLPERLRNNTEFWDYLRENPEILEYVQSNPEYFNPENLPSAPPAAWFGLFDLFDPSAPLPDNLTDNPEFSGISGIENAQTVGDLLILLKDNYSVVSFQSRFPTTGLPVAEYEGGRRLNEIVVTDFLVYLVMKHLGTAVAPYYDLNIPTEGEELRAFLHSGFEAVLIDCFNKLNSVTNISPLRVVGILDTGYKEKYFKYVNDPSQSIEVEYLNYAFNANNYYARLYAAKGFSKNCYNGKLMTTVFDYSTEASGILAQYSAMGLVGYADGYSPSDALADNEVVMTENAFIHLFGFTFDSNPRVYTVENPIDGMPIGGYKVVGVIKNASGENLFERDFGVILSVKGFAETVGALSKISAIRVSITADEASALFSYMQKNGLQSVSIYSTLLSYVAPTIDNLKAVFIPVAILIALIALTAMPMFLITAITKKQKDIGVMKALGMKAPDIIKIYLVESAATIVSVLILSSLAVDLVCNIANAAVAQGIRFLSQELIKLIVLLYVTELPYIINAVAIIVIGVVSVIYPTLKISRLSPVEAMKKE